MVSKGVIVEHPWGLPLWDWARNSGASTAGKKVADEEMAGLTRRVRAVLESHRGEGRAISGRALARQLGQRDPRRVRAAIAELVGDGEMIGASPDGATGGYYLIETFAELESNLAVLDSRAKKILSRRRALRVSGERAFGRKGQAVLFEG